MDTITKTDVEILATLGLDWESGIPCEMTHERTVCSGPARWRYSMGCDCGSKLVCDATADWTRYGLVPGIPVVCGGCNVKMPWPEFVSKLQLTKI